LTNCIRCNEDLSIICQECNVEISLDPIFFCPYCGQTTYKIFIGEQYSDDSTFCDFIKKSARVVPLKIRDQIIYPRDWDPGENLLFKICDAIKSCDICYYDTTEFNFNVGFEYGYSVGKFKLFYIGFYKNRRRELFPSSSDPLPIENTEIYLHLDKLRTTGPQSNRILTKNRNVLKNKNNKLLNYRNTQDNRKNSILPSINHNHKHFLLLCRHPNNTFPSEIEARFDEQYDFEIKPINRMQSSKDAHITQLDQFKYVVGIISPNPKNSPYNFQLGYFMGVAFGMGKDIKFLLASNNHNDFIDIEDYLFFNRNRLIIIDQLEEVFNDRFQ